MKNKAGKITKNFKILKKSALFLRHLVIAAKLFKSFLKFAKKSKGAARREARRAGNPKKKIRELQAPEQGSGKPKNRKS